MFIVPGDRSGRKRVSLSSPNRVSGRLTLATATPVMTSSQSAKTTIYWTPYLGRHAPLWNGSAFIETDMGGELSNLTANSSVGNAGPAAVTTNKNYDLFLWGRSGSYYLTRGGAWNSDTARSSGTENDLNLLQGVYVNLNAIANGPPANFGTYVGTVRSNGSSQIDWIYGARATGGTAGVLGVWNMYNRLPFISACQDSTSGGYTYTSVTVRQMDGSTGNQISFVNGLNEDSVQVLLTSRIQASGGQFLLLYLGLDSVTSGSGAATLALGILADAAVFATYNGLPGLGYHYFAALESGSGAGSSVNLVNSSGNQYESLNLIWRG
jgi:hypothetical protein